MTRKGARRMSEIPPAILKALNEGREETRTLVEWLAIDTDTLLGHVLKDIGLAREAARLRRAFAPCRAEGISRRTKAVGRILHEGLPAAPPAYGVRQALEAPLGRGALLGRVHAPRRRAAAAW